MWFIRNLIAKMGFGPEVWIRYNDGKDRKGQVVGESRKDYCIRAQITLGMFFRPFREHWVPKTDPALRSFAWPLRAKVAGMALIAVPAISTFLLLLSLLLSFPNGNESNDYDAVTGLPVLGICMKSEPLPDGHYTVHRIGDYGAAVVIQHKPGPDRDFVYYVLHRDLNESVPDDVKPGDRFRVLNGKFVYPYST